MRLFLVLMTLFFWANSSFAQMNNQTDIRPRDKTAYIETEAKTPRKMKGYLKNYGDQKIARNILIVRAVSGYKITDEKLEKEFEKLENNREYHEKLQKIMKALSNKKFRNSKNRAVIDILDEAGNKLYNLLAN